MTRLIIVRRGLKKLPRPPGARLRSMSWLAAEFGISRQGLYMILHLERRNKEVEETLSELFPKLPEWPQRGYGDTSGAVPIREVVRHPAGGGR